MKLAINFNFYKFKILILIVLINIFSPNKILFSSFMETGIEEDLVKLLTKLQNKKFQEKNLKEKNIVNVKVENLYDLKEYMSILDKIKFKNEQERDDYKTRLEKSLKTYESRIQKSQNSLSELKNKYDHIIDKTNILSKELNDKKNEELKIKSSYEIFKSEMETKNDKINSQYKQLKNNFEKKNEELIAFQQKLTNFNQQVRTEKNAKQEYLQQKKEHKYIDNDILLNNKLLKEEESDKKFFEIINNNIGREAKQISLSSMESVAKLGNLRKLSLNNENTAKLEIEKSQQTEYSRDYNKKIKELLKDHENVENDIKDLMQKKNRLKVEINKKETETNIKKNEYSADLNNLSRKIKFTENGMLNNLKEHKKYLMNKEVKIKNIILILNKLLIKNRNSDSHEENANENMMNNLLFDNKIIDLNKGIEDGIIEEISESILNN